MIALEISPAAIEALARRRFGDPNPRLSSPRELRFGRRGSVAVDLVHGVWIDHESGQGGGLRELGGTWFPAASMSAADRRRSDERHAAEARRKRCLAARLWASASPLIGSLGERYFREARAIAAPLDRADLRFAQAAPLRPLAPVCHDTAPAVVAKVSDATGAGLGVHLTFLQSDGMGKAEIEAPRKLVGRCGGGMIRLEPGPRLIVAEGIESALSAWDAVGPQRGLGATAAISAGGVAGLPWPPGTVELILAPDQDASGAGERASLRLVERAYAAGLRVGLLRPPKPFCDWNDWARVSRRRT